MLTYGLCGAPAQPHGLAGFVKDKQRINVAISRSLYGLVVVGDDHTLSSDDDWRAVRQACERNSLFLPPSIPQLKLLTKPLSFTS
jgi:superfamily I DNA and/or RNA helicase